MSWENVGILLNKNNLKELRIFTENKVLVTHEDKDYTAKELSKLPYFAYGSNLWKSQMQERCPDSEPLGKCYLEDYKLIFRKVADITKRKRANVRGALYKVSPEDIMKLNRYEGFPFKYVIRIGKVKINKDESVNCFWYEIKNKKSHLTQEPEVSYLAKIAIGYSEWKLQDECILDAIKRARISVKNRERKQVLDNIEKKKLRFTMTNQ